MFQLYINPSMVLEYTQFFVGHCAKWKKAFAVTHHFFNIRQFISHLQLNKDCHFPFSPWIMFCLALLTAEPNPNPKNYLNIARRAVGGMFLLLNNSRVIGQQALESVQVVGCLWICCSQMYLPTTFTLSFWHGIIIAL